MIQLDGFIRMNIERKIDMEGWEPRRIVAFMEVLARMIALTGENWEEHVKDIDALVEKTYPEFDGRASENHEAAH